MRAPPVICQSRPQLNKTLSTLRDHGGASVSVKIGLHAAVDEIAQVGGSWIAMGDAPRPRHL